MSFVLFVSSLMKCVSDKRARLSLVKVRNLNSESAQFIAGNGCKNILHFLHYITFFKLIRFINYTIKLRELVEVVNSSLTYIVYGGIGLLSPVTSSYSVDNVHF